MQMHDWTRVEAGVFHAFHSRWTTYLGDALNAGILPGPFYALPEQHLGRRIADVLTLHSGDSEPLGKNFPPTEDGGVAVAEAPPRVSRTLVLTPTMKKLRRTLAIRHTSGHRLVALIEILSPGNKAGVDSVAEFVRKAEEAIRAGIHLAVLDLLPPGRHDPQGMHGEIVDALSAEVYQLPEGNPLTFVSYSAGPAPVAYLNHPAIGDDVPDMPLFLTAERYVNLPLTMTYETTYRGVPAFWREVIEGQRPAPNAR